MCIAIVTQSLLALIILPLEFEMHFFTFMIYRPWRFFIQIGNLMGIISSVILLFLPESPKFMISIAKEKDSLIILKQIYKMNSGNVKSKVISLKFIASNHFFILFFQKYPVLNVYINDERELRTVKGIRDACSLVWKQTSPLFGSVYIRHTLLLATISFLVFFVSQSLLMW